MRVGVAIAAAVVGQLTMPTNEEVEKYLHATLAEPVFQPEAVPVRAISATDPGLCDSSVKQQAGYVKVSATSKYFFWMFESQGTPSTDPVVMWLSGGPGCSSQLALFAENGPCKVDKNGTTTSNPSSWHTNANVIWVDQPSGTGFSTGLGVHDEAGVAANMYEFMQGFYQQYPQYKNNEFYLFGESYAGHYVPAISHKLWQPAAKGDFQVPLKGISIGNGLTDPEEQYKWYADMAHDGGKAEGGSLGHGVINSTVEYAAMKAAIGPCVNSIHACNNGGNSSACMSAYTICNYASQIPYKLTGLNPYDMRIPCEHGNLCYDFDAIADYLNTPAVQKALGVTKKWASCNYAVDLSFVAAGDWMKNFHTLLPPMLADGIKVHIYAGDVDFICNFLGNKKWTMALEWPHKADFNAAEDKEFTVNGKVAGRSRTASGLTFTQVYQAGHMVPMDQPEASLHIVNNFIHGQDPTSVVV